MSTRYVSLLGINISFYLIIFFFLFIKGKLSYNEELCLSLIYVGLFWIFFFKLNNFTKNFLIKQIIDIIDFYEKIYYLKMKILIKERKFLKIIKNKAFAINFINLLNLNVKEKKNIYIENKKKYNKILLLCFVILLLNK